MKASFIRSLVVVLVCFCCNVILISQGKNAANEATIEAEKVIEIIRSNKYESLAELLELRIRYSDLISKSNLQSGEKISTFNTLGYLFYTEGIPTESIRCYKRLFANYKEWKIKNINKDNNHFLPERTFAYAIMSRSYAKLNELDSAAIYQKKAISISEESETIFYPSALNNYGLYLTANTNEKDSALYYFQSAYEITRNDHPEHSLLGSIRDNLADIYLEQGAVEQARDLYSQNFLYFSSYILENGQLADIGRCINAGIQLIKTNRLLNDDKAWRNNFKKLESSISNQVLPPNFLLEYSNFKHEYFEKENKIDSAYHYAKKSLVLTNKLNQAEGEKRNDFTYVLNEIILERVELLHGIEQNQKENQLTFQRLITGIILLLAIVIITIIYFLYQRRNQLLINAENERFITDQAFHLEKLKSEKLKLDIASKERDLSDFAINLSQNYEWARELYDKFQIINEKKGRVRAKLLDEFEEDIRNKINYNEDTEEFFHRLDLLNDAFYRKLNDDITNLSKTEKRLCSLIRLKLESHQIASFQNITLASVNTARYRLRKKLGLADGVNLDDYISRL